MSCSAVRGRAHLSSGNDSLRSAPGAALRSARSAPRAPLGARPAVLTANSRRRLLNTAAGAPLANGHCFCCCRRDSPRRLADCLPAALLVSAAARHGRQVCAGGSRALPSWHATAGGRPTRARSARPRWPRLREADRALQLLLPTRLPAPRLPARCRPCAECSAGRDSGCGKGGPARPAAIGTSTYAYSGARQSAAQHSRSQRFLAALSLFRATALSPYREPSSLCLPVPPSSSLPSPFPLPASRCSLPLSPSVCPWPAFFFSLRSSNVSLFSALCQRNGRQANSELDRQS